MIDCVFSLDTIQLAEFGKSSDTHSSCWCSNSRVSKNTAFISSNKVSVDNFFHSEVFRSACYEMHSLLWYPQQQKLPRERFVVSFPYSQARFLPKLRSKVPLDNFISSENDSNICLCFRTLFRNPDELIMPTNAKNNGRIVFCGKLLKTRFKTLSKRLMMKHCDWYCRR